MGSYTVDVCPHCSRGVQNSWTILPIRSALISCHHCKQTVMATRGAVARSWQNCFLGFGALIIWVGFLVVAASRPDLGFPMFAVLLVGWFPSMIVASPLMIVGFFVGVYKGSKMGLPDSD